MMKYVKLYEAFLEEKITKPKKPKTFVVKGYTMDEKDPKPNTDETTWDDDNFGDLFDARAPKKTVNEDSDKERYAKQIKDMDEVRPRMAPAPKTDGMMASQGSKYFDLYLQDEAAAVCIDKYGYEKGIKNWEWFIDQSSGAMFAATAKIANEKYKMLKDLGLLDKYGKNYFERSYFDLWKEWKEWMKTGQHKQAA